ncbi:Glycine betaine transporter OpuD [Vibrio aerogenes CECT 7868]|uniref:Glycine betaine transporter OpuD n=1 Tax=Vibrio aerogenes CECT 7868 TaxID=1216006 RepID=A0A1M6BVZ9_9VIBR|nr:BCCT family transporter [Vibrio aerogenes]SHI52930.1 Glycine betaine transporter OpuD [Vibrio aerogenes CECT 7868]
MKPSSMVKGAGNPSEVNKTMFYSSVIMVLIFVGFSILRPEQSKTLFSTFNSWINTNLSWYYVAVVCFTLFFSVWVTFSKYGKIRLGKDDEKPEFNFIAWFSMLFSCAIGTGLLFWSIAEPIYHFQGNPFIEAAGIAPKTEQAAQVALRITMFHWGLHGWAIYILVGLCLAYYCYRRGLPLTVRSGLYPILGDRIHGPIGHAVDLLAVFSTLFGTATTLGLGVSQMNAGLNFLFGTEISTTTQVILIVVVSVIATVSAVTGVGKGIKLLSLWNIRLSTLLVGFFLFAGPTVFLLKLTVTSLGDYVTHFLPMGFWVDMEPGRQWQGWWTVFYWGWWLSWGPLVGMFIARISRGRTIREFMLSALIIPPLGGFLWIIIFGGTALNLQMFGGANLIDVVNKDMTLALYSTIESLGYTSLTHVFAALATFLIITWFVTSADSGTLVISTIVSDGNRNPVKWLRIVWGVALGLISAVLLVNGGLDALKTATIIAALPFSVVLLFMCFALTKGLRDEANGLVYSAEDLAKFNVKQTAVQTDVSKTAYGYK